MQSYYADGVWYIYTAKMVETFHGPENRITIWPENHREFTMVIQECAGTEQCVHWGIEAIMDFKKQMQSII